MTTGLVDIDHLMISVRDSQSAGTVFERMGFTVTPHSILPGLSNRLICFAEQHPGACNFIELMALENAAEAPPMMSGILLPARRPVSMVMSSADIDRTFEALRERHIQAPPPIPLSRDWALPSGEVITPAFAVLIPKPGQSPYYWNVCLHKTPQHYQRAEFVQHPNGVVALTAVIAVAADPASVGAHYQRLWGAELVGDNPVRIRLGAVELRIYSPSALENTFPAAGLTGGNDSLVGFAVSHATPVRLTNHLKKAGFAPHGGDGSIYLAPAETEGNLMVFEPLDG